MFACWTWGFTSAVTLQGHSLTRRLCIPQNQFVYKTSELQEVAMIVSWEMSPRSWINGSEAFSLLDWGHPVPALFSAFRHSNYRADLYLAQISWSFLKLEVNAGQLQCVCIPPAAAPSWWLLFGRQAQTYLSCLSELVPLWDPAG